MANPIIQIRRSAVAGKIPSTTQLSAGELAINTYDGKIYIKQDQSGVGVGTTVITINPWNVGLGSISYNLYFTAGNVGLGTTNPTTKLDVNGDIRLRAQLYDFNNTVGTAGSVLTATDSGVIWKSTSIGIGTTSPAAPVPGTLWYNNNLGRIFIYYNDGNSSQWVDAAPFNQGLLTSAVSIGVTIGTSASPSIYFNSYPTTGFFSPSANNFTIVSSGSSILNVNPNGINVTGVVTATTFVGALTGTATSTTNIPNLTGAITSVNTTTSLGSFTSANLATALTDETGSGANVFATSPTLVTPVLGAATGTSLTLNGAGSATVAQLTFSGTTNNWIDYGTNGVAAPAFTTRSAGTKVVLYNQIGASTADYALGIESSTLWFGVPNTGTQFKWYGGTTLAATLSGTGAFTVTQLNVSGISTFTSGPVLVGTATSTGTASQPLQVTGGAYVSGNLGIGSTNPTTKLYVVGDTYVTGVVTATDFNSASDIRLKTNIQQIQNPLDKVIQINGVAFDWKSTKESSIGVIAQDIEKVFPELVKESEHHKSVNYNGLIGVLIEAVKELKAEVEELKKR